MDGVLADDLLLEMKEGLIAWNDIPNKFLPEGIEKTGKEIKVAAFDEGEILICDECGVEIGAMRKPWKWDVDYEMFDNVEDAMRKSLEVRGMTCVTDCCTGSVSKHQCFQPSEGRYTCQQEHCVRTRK